MAQRRPPAPIPGFNPESWSSTPWPSPSPSPMLPHQHRQPVNKETTSDEVVREKTYKDGKIVLDSIEAIHAAEKKQADADAYMYSEENRELKEKYEKELKETRARELMYAEETGTQDLDKELKKEKLKAATALKEPQEKAEQKLRGELQRKDEERSQQIEKPQESAKAEVAATIAKEKASQIQQIAEANINVSKETTSDEVVREKTSEDGKIVLDSIEAIHAAEKKQADADASMYSEEKREFKVYPDADIDKMKRKIEELEKINADLNQRLEVAELQSKNSVSTNPSHEYCGEINRCHDLFICSNESGFVKLQEKISDPDPMFKIIRSVQIHGVKVMTQLKELKDTAPLYVPPPARKEKEKNADSEQEFKGLSPFGKIPLMGIIENIYRLHRKGFCLNGQFTLKSFYYTNDKKVKMEAKMKLIAQDRTRPGMIKDYHQVKLVIQTILELQKEQASKDLQAIIDLLSCPDPVEHEDIIRYNISLMTEILKKAHFITLYDRWLQMKRRDEDIEKEAKKTRPANEIRTELYDSEKVLQFIATTSTDSEGNIEAWSNRVSKNSYVDATTQYWSRQSRKQIYDASALLTVWRNELTHILDDSNEKFFDEDLVNMLESAYPGVFNDLQNGMAAVGHQELPHLMRCMRM